MARKKDYKQLNTSPLDTGIRNFTATFKYFTYYAPNIDSCQTSGKIEGERADEVLRDMLVSANIRNKSRFLKSIKRQSWAKSDFDTDIIDFEDSRMLCDVYGNETELTALLRHIRNAFAHGYIYIWKKRSGNFVFFVDYKKENNRPPRISAKILISMSILERWKAILENEIATGE